MGGPAPGRRQRDVPSSIAWLDSSREEQQRMRELLNLFSETESRDELGIGRIRDAFGDSLFPGTSTLHTRARYFLLVPWCFQAASRRRLTGAALTAAAEYNERIVLVTLKRSGVTEGLIGRVVGADVKTLPSAIYWGALAQYGIRRVDSPQDTLSTRVLAAGSDEAEEATDLAEGPWCPTLPPIPDGFPNTVPGGLDLDVTEAGWLRDRMLDGAGASLLGHLLGAGRRPATDSWTPWTDPATEDASPSVRGDLLNAELFSLAMHGASLLYNLLVAERYERAGLTVVEAPIDAYRERLVDWGEDVADEPRLATWDREAMWQQVTGRNPRIGGVSGMRTFVNRWLDGVDGGRASDAATDDGLRSLVAVRERSVKKGQSRLANDSLLRAWSGASGSARLIYRWTQVRRLLLDVHDGLEGAPRAAA